MTVLNRRPERIWAALALVVAAVAPLIGPVTKASAAESGRPPIEIEAEEGIEWRQQEKLILARGNARAVRGEVEVRAETLSARYRERPDGEVEIWQVDAIGDVVISSPRETIHSQRGTFDLDDNLLVLSGGTVRLTADDSEVTADDRMEYQTRTRVLTARGNAVARQADQQMRGDTLTIQLREPSEEGGRLARIDGDRNVWIITPTEIMRGDQGIYDARAGRATLIGSVKVTRGESQLSGCRGELDLRTGVGQLLACDDATPGPARVHGLIVPGGGGRGE